MKNIAINTIEYTGIVKLSQYIGSKKVEFARFHNSGSYSLFNFFADCLIGDFDVAKLHRPTKIMLLSQDETTKEYSSLSGFIYQTSKPEKVYATTKGSVKYSFIIPKDLITTIQAESISSIGLYADSARDGDVDDYSAIVPVSLNADKVAASSAVIVDWVLNISNRNAEVEA